MGQPTSARAAQSTGPDTRQERGVQVPLPRAAEPRSDQIAAGGVMVAAALLMIGGVLQMLAGITALVHGRFYVQVQDYLVSFSPIGWGLAHLIVGALLVAVGISLLARRPWAYVTAMVVAGLSIVGNFLFVPFYPLWSLLIIAIDVVVIWALARSLSAARS